MSLTDVILALVILIVLATMIIPAIINFIIEIKCFDLVIQYRFLGGSCWEMKGCGNDDCRLKRFCPIYQNAITTEVVSELESMLDERCRELEMEGEE